MTGKTFSSLQAVGVIHICFFSKHHIQIISISVSISTIFKPEATFSLTKDVNRTQKRSFMKSRFTAQRGQHTMMLETHNDAWYTGNNALSGTWDESCWSDDPVKMGLN